MKNVKSQKCTSVRIKIKNISCEVFARTYKIHVMCKNIKKKKKYSELSRYLLRYLMGEINVYVDQVSLVMLIQARTCIKIRDVIIITIVPMNYFYRLFEFHRNDLPY